MTEPGYESGPPQWVDVGDVGVLGDLIRRQARDG